MLDKALSKIGEKSLFTKELEVALEAGEVICGNKTMAGMKSLNSGGLCCAQHERFAHIATTRHGYWCCS